MEKFTGQKLLAEIAQNAPDWSVRYAAMKKLTDFKRLSAAAHKADVPYTYTCKGDGKPEKIPVEKELI